MLRKIDTFRPLIHFALFVALCRGEHWILATVMGFAAFFSFFILLHDAMHGALWLPRWANEALITIAGLMLLKSGHCLRASHLRHHQKPLADDDPEGAVASWPLWRVIVVAPFHILALHVRGVKLAPKTARLQIVETIGVVALLVLTAWIKAPVLMLYAAVCFLGTTTMPLWAAYIPHGLAHDNIGVRIATALARWWTPVLSTLAYHELHHRHPKVRTIDLPAFAKATR